MHWGAIRHRFAVVLFVLGLVGLVFSVQGKGTFVSKPKAVQNVQRLQGFGEAMVPQGYEASTRVIGSTLAGLSQ